MRFLWEAVQSGFQPCSYSVVIVALLMLGLRRNGWRWPALGAFWLGAVSLAWLPITGVDPIVDDRLIGAAALLAGMVWVGLASRTGILGAAVVGAFAGATWVPCVGPELGRVLTRGIFDPPSALAPLAIYLAGTIILPILACWWAETTPSVRRLLDRPRVRTGLWVVALLLSVGVATGAYERAVGELARLAGLSYI